MKNNRWEVYSGDDVAHSQTIGRSDQFRFCARTLTEGKSRGVQMVTLDCGQMSVDVLPTRGMGIWKARRNGVPFGWDSPVQGPIHPNFVPLSEPSGLGWLDGFDEMMVRCGLESNGAPEFDERGALRYGVHGKIANTPAQNVVIECDQDTGWISVSGSVAETRFLFHRFELQTTIQLNLESNRITVTDRIINQGGTPASFQILYHNNFGQPVLSAAATFEAPVKQLAPRDANAAKGINSWQQFVGPTSGFAEQVYFMDLFGDRDQRSMAMLCNQPRDKGVRVGFNTAQLPCFTLWKNSAAQADGYVCGLEPATNYPNPRSFEQTQGRVVSLSPGQLFEIELTFDLLSGSDEIDAVSNQIESLQVEPPIINSQPNSDWSN